MSSKLVPLRIAFIWFGQSLPDFAEFAIRSAARNNPEASVTLLHSSDLEPGTGERLEGATLEPIDIAQLIGKAVEKSRGLEQPALDAVLLHELWNAVHKPAARANLVRLLWLYTEGGIYLDADTLTVKDLSPLLDCEAFCGLEHLLWPKEKLNMKHPYFWVGGPLLTLLRQLSAKLPRGYAIHQKTQGLYSTAVNNAVLGFRSGHPVLYHALARASKLDARERVRQFRLGTHLLQEVLAAPEQPGAHAVRLLSPEHFYPLGPVVSEHYFRRVKDPKAVAKSLVTEHTYVIHWYASVSDLSALGKQHVRKNAQSSVYAHLCSPYLEPGRG